MRKLLGYNGFGFDVIPETFPLSKQLIKRFNEAQSQLVVQTADLPLGTLAEMVKSGAIDLKPGFQRRERWTPEKQSALIESFLLNVPVPPIYLAEEDDGTYAAILTATQLRWRHALDPSAYPSL